MSEPPNGDRFLECCLVCGETLEYLERGDPFRCAWCGREETGNVVCPMGHYICESCHSAGFLASAGPALERSHEASPFRLAEELLARPALPMLGCEHAWVAAGAVMVSLRNRPETGVTQAHVDEALSRTTKQAISAYCGLTGVCGVVPALGACLSVLVGAHCGKGPETRLTMELVSRLAGVTAAEADPGCCKAFVRSGIREFAVFAEDRLGLTFPDPESVLCRDTARHPHGCRGPACAYHPEREEPPMPSLAPTTGPGAQARYDEFFALAYSDGVLDAKTKVLVALGASLAAGCAP